MRSQSAVFVDAGYLMAGIATKLAGSSLRRAVTVNYEKLIAELIALVEERSGIPVLRVYWYDAARDGVPEPDHETIAALPKVKVRLGRVGMEGEQKGVDLRIGLDMVGHARNGAVDTIYLLSGDDDLTEAVDEAQAQGVSVVVLAVPNSDGGPHGLSRNLVRTADDVEVLADSLIAATAERAKILVGHSGGGVPSPADLVRSKHGVPGPSPARVAAASATSPAAQRTAPPSPYSGAASGRSTSVAYSGTSGSAPYVAPGYGRDPAEVTAILERVVARTFEAWRASATQEQRNELHAGYPTIPPDLDRALLVDSSEALDIYTLPDPMRTELRSAFWRHADEVDPR